MKRLFSPFLLVILFAYMPVVHADTESLYVDSKTNDLQNWDERNEPSPYLADESTGYIHEVKSSAAMEGYFGFVDPSGTGTITSVYIYLECYGEDTNDQVHIYLDCDDGSGFLLAGTITVDQTSYLWESLYLGRLDSWADIQNARIYFYYLGVGGGDDIYIRRSYLYVDYTPAGAEHTREVSQGLTVSTVSSRTWTLSRSLTQTMATATLSSRSWATSRTTTQGISVVTTSTKTWSLSRVLTQSLSFSSNTIADIFKSFRRTLTLGLSFTSDSFRSWDLTRTLSQGINLASDSLRGWTLSRTLTQSMSFLSNAFAQLTAGGGTEFLRSVALGLSLSSDSLRTWGLSRTMNQGLTVTSDSIGQKLLGQLIKRLLSLDLNLDSTLAVTMRIVNEFNSPLLMSLLAAVVFTSIYWLKGEEPDWLGFLCGFIWICNAVAMLYVNATYWPFALIASAVGLVCWYLTMSKILELRDVPWV